MTEPSEGWPTLANEESPTDLPHWLATTSMVLGIVGFVLLLWFGVWPISMLALIVGILAIRRIDAGRAGGRRRAITGIVTGGLGLMHILNTLVVLAPLLQATA